MSWLAFVPLFIAPADVPPATAHERVLAPRILPLGATKELAAGDTPKSVWRVDSSDNATHWQSTMNCPVTMKSFQRKDLIPFDGYGLDVGCTFDRPTGDAVITVYLTRRTGSSFAETFTSAQEALKQRLPEAKLIAGDVPMPKGQTFTGALYELGDGARTGVWVADVSGWTLKFRATYVPNVQTEVLDAMSELSDKARATAGTHLAACAAAPAVQRNGTEITDKDRLMGLSIVGAVSAIDDGDKAPAKISEQWCVEDPAGDREIPMLFWRNIANKDAAGAMDRMSFMTVSEPPILFSEANPFASEVDDKSKADKVIVHQLTLIQNDTTYIFAFFSGRPAAATIAPLAKDLVLNKKAPIASYTKGTNTITIPMAKAKPES